MSTASYGARSWSVGVWVWQSMRSTELKRPVARSFVWTSVKRQSVRPAPEAAATMATSGSWAEATEASVAATLTKHLTELNEGDRLPDREPPSVVWLKYAFPLTALQKVGYDGTVVLDPGPQGSTKETLVRAKAAKRSRRTARIAAR